MPSPNEKLADSLSKLAALQAQGHRVIKGKMLTRVHQERLVNAGFLQEVIRGWYLPSRPGDQPGSSAAWFAGMRDFVAGYGDERFGAAWHLSPEQSLLLRSGERTLPKQLQIWAEGGNNQGVALPHGCSLFIYRATALLPATAEAAEGGLRLVSVAHGLIGVGPGFYAQQPMAAKIALSMVEDVGDVLSPLLAGNHTTVAGRLAGAFRSVGKPAMADAIVGTMRSVGHHVVEASPFAVSPEPLPGGRAESPYVQRLRLTWAAMRQGVIDAFPAPQAPSSNVRLTLEDVEARYVSDAYHSLSIEGYRVTPDLIERVRQGAWDPLGADNQHRDAMAAKGYFDTHEQVKAYIAKCLLKPHDHTRFELQEALSAWYRAMFGPSVQAGILKPQELAGWRHEQVFIRGALHVPQPKEAVRDCMPVLFELIAAEPHPAVRAILGHFLFVYIHPYMDGNGRLGRFLMNAMLVTGGYVWTVVPVEMRTRYMDALEQASSFGHIAPFAELMAQLVRGQASEPLPRP
jgi:hypothetical protein